MTSNNTIFGFSGTSLSHDEIAFFKDAKPWGFILFQRNIETKEQVHFLCETLRILTGRDNTPILIDQEGGRVRRLMPPLWRFHPSAQMMLEVYLKDPVKGRELVRLNALCLAKELKEIGININCAPVLDLKTPHGNKDVIGDRSFGTDPDTVSILGRAFAEGLLAGSVLPVIKHIPGHGQASVDSHKELPVVCQSLQELDRFDFKPFKALSDLPAALPAHIVYAQLDPDHPATLSSLIIQDIIRKRINFKGLLITDDLSMKALSGSYRNRSEKALKAGCDILLHCNGIMDEMKEVAQASHSLRDISLERAQTALHHIDHLEEPIEMEWAKRVLEENFGKNFLLES